MIRIETLKIENYRALQSLRVTLHPMTTIIGENDVGKSSCMFALRTFFEANKIDRKTDIFMGDDTLPVLIELSFCLDHPNESQKPYLTQGRLTLRARYEFDSPRLIEVISQQPKESRFRDLDSKNLSDLRSIWNDVSGSKDSSKLAKDDVKSKIRDWMTQNVHDFQESRIELSEREFNKIVPDFVLVPVTRDFDLHTKMTETSLFGKLFKPLFRGTLSETSIQTALTNICTLLRKSVGATVSSLEELMREQMNNPSVSLTHAVDLDLMKGVDFEFGMDDERARNIPMSNRGAGVHNNLILAMFRSHPKIHVRGSGMSFASVTLIGGMTRALNLPVPQIRFLG